MTCRSRTEKSRQSNFDWLHIKEVGNPEQRVSHVTASYMEYIMSELGTSKNKSYALNQSVWMCAYHLASWNRTARSAAAPGKWLAPCHWSLLPCLNIAPHLKRKELVKMICRNKWLKTVGTKLPPFFYDVSKWFYWIRKWNTDLNFDWLFVWNLLTTRNHSRHAISRYLLINQSSQ